MHRPLMCVPVLVAALVSLAACDDGKGGTSISLNSSDADGNVVASVDGGGQAVIDTPFFKGKVTIPKLTLDAKNFDMNGVHLYPGSTISGMNIDAHDKPGTDNDGTVRLDFASPAAPATVRAWFKEKLAAADFKLDAKGDGLEGKTDEGEPFKLVLTPDGANKAKGVITIG